MHKKVIISDADGSEGWGFPPVYPPYFWREAGLPLIEIPTPIMQA